MLEDTSEFSIIGLYDSIENSLFTDGELDMNEFFNTSSLRLVSENLSTPPIQWKDITDRFAR